MSDGAGTELGPVTVFAATAVEARPLRRRLGGIAGITVERTGIGAGQRHGVAVAVAISCGLAGGLDSRLPSGTVVIPDAVGDGGGELHACDPMLLQRLRVAAERCGVTAHPGPLLTVDHVVSGAERDHWARRGYAAVDMESALLVSLSRRFAALRVVLDTPSRELSPAWTRPRRAVLSPRLWGQALWLARAAPQRCDLAAAIVALALCSPRSRAGGAGQA